MRNTAKKQFGAFVTAAVTSAAGALAAPVIQNPSFENISAEQADPGNPPAVPSHNTLNNPGNVDAATYAARIDNWTPTLNGGRFGSVAPGSEFTPPGPTQGTRLLGLGITPASTGPISIQQSVSGWDPTKVYLLRFDASSRNNPEFSDMQVFTDAQQIVNLPAVPNGNLGPYQSRFFTPASATQILKLQTTATGDRTLWVDNLRLSEFSSIGSGLVKNPSMEIDARLGGLFDGNGYGTVSGWNGASGLNSTSGGANPFADNGTIPNPPAGDYGDDADPGAQSVLFRQGSGDVTQSIAGLVVGNQYTLSYVENSRVGSAGNATLTASASIGGLPVVAPHLVGMGAYVPQSGTFTVTAGMLDANGNALLDFNTLVPAGDRSWLLDNVSITAVPEPTSIMLLALAGFGLATRPKRA